MFIINKPIRSAKSRIPQLTVSATLIAITGTPLSGHALSLMEAYRAALEKDPTFQSARYNRAVGEEYQTLGRAALLPQVSASYSMSKNDANRIITGSNGAEQKDNPQYTSKVATIQLRQPLFNLDGWQRYKGSQAQYGFSEAKYVSDSQDLIDRLTTSYLAALLAEDQLRLAEAQRDALQENQIANKNMFEKGAGTSTDMIETRARFELAQAAVIEAEDVVKNRRDELAVIVGADPGTLDSLPASMPNLPLAPETLAEWETLATANNPDVRAQRHSVEYARTEVERNRAGHYPRIDLVASYSKNTSDSLFTYNQESTVNSIGVQLSLPIYSGGSATAQTRQAAARLGAGQADYDSSLQKALVEVRKQFQLVKSGRIRMTAMEQAVRSAAEAVEATRKSVAGGQRVNLDVLTAIQQLYTTQRDFSEARHGYLLAFLRLHAAAGLLSDDDLGKIAACFEARP